MFVSSPKGMGMSVILSCEAPPVAVISGAGRLFSVNVVTIFYSVSIC